jgi:hypothetical protein
MYLQQSKLWWDSLVRDVGADTQGRVCYIALYLKADAPYGHVANIDVE